MTRDAIATDKLAAPVGPFSLGVRGVGLLFLSGQVAQDPATGRLIDGDVARQAHQILHNIATALETIGKSLEDVLRVGVYLTDIADFRGDESGVQLALRPALSRKNRDRRRCSAAGRVG